MKRNFLLIVFLTVIGVLLLGNTSYADTYTYDASLNTLPEAQGWTKFLNESPNPGVATLHSTEGGYLNLNTTEPGMFNWTMNEGPFNFADGVTVEATLRINSSSFKATNCAIQRTGYYLAINDDTTQTVWTALASDRAYLMFGNEFESNFKFRDLADGDFHNFKMTSDAEVYKLFIDDELVVVNGPLRSDTSSRQNYFGFGDFSNSGWSNTDLKFFRATVAPEPISTVLFLVGGIPMGMALKKRFRKVA